MVFLEHGQYPFLRVGLKSFPILYLFCLFQISYFLFQVSYFLFTKFLKSLKTMKIQLFIRYYYKYQKHILCKLNIFIPVFFMLIIFNFIIFIKQRFYIKIINSINNFGSFANTLSIRHFFNSMS
ncbi:hypothetical protein ES703_28315 [subsurface metagenome]